MIYLGGGGSSTDEENVFRAVFQSPPQRIIIWPFAQPETRWPGIKTWVQESVAPFGDFPSIGIGKEPGFGLDEADIIVIPGGNTFALLNYLQERGLVEQLRDFAQSGGTVYGGSAGAIILGADIEICDAGKGGMDNNEVGLKDASELGLLGGCVVHPHYEESWREHCERWSVEKGVVVIGIPERGGLTVGEEGKAVNLGPEDVWLFEAGVGERWAMGEERMMK
ncbi:hypothetical protein QQS21_009811 [Conoideocrella luteorostrata]|uniref:Peptidase E n=1 Tax=Conoideocrella luteorostrata TaxID=1105319 RepID=A0AAJ0FXG9_9HYPO|nr:hypothetical protein QQS21_009811 [Conoideocrella luteorostrata]